MSPRAADPAVRIALIEAAAGIVASEGRAALTLRRLATSVGTSTMAIYTHFGSMEELRRAVRIEGFSRLRSRLAAVRTTRDPMADLIVLGAAYYLSATSAPNLYRAMFLDGPVGAEDAETGLDTFMFLVDGVARCVEAGRLPGLGAGSGAGAGSAASAEAAVQVWALEHGLVTLQLAHLLAPADAVRHVDAGARSLLLAWGDTPAALRRSYRAARRRIEGADAT